MFRLKIFFHRLTRQIWPKVSLFAVLAAGTAVLAIFLKPFIPESLSRLIGADTVDSLLNILASSMLAVTTFSLSTMVAAYGAATSSVTPRSTRLIMEDPTTHTVLSVFLGTFVFSLVGIICLNIGIYEGSGRFVLFLVTLAVILLILVTLIRWIEHLSKLGRVAETTRAVEKATQQALQKRAAAPFLGGNPLMGAGDVPAEARDVKVRERQCGYVQSIDMDRLEKLARTHDLRIFVLALPGKFLTPGQVFARICGPCRSEIMEEAAACCVTGEERLFEEDPRFGLCVLAEIAARALPPAVSDPGTAIDVTGRLIRLLTLYGTTQPAETPAYPHIWVLPLRTADLFDDAFRPLARGGAQIYEVQARLQKAFVCLGEIDPEFRAAARRHSRRALQQAERALVLEEEKAALRAMAPG